MVDLDADGRRDVVTGHYWPGDVHWFRGRADGGFDAASFPRDEIGRALNAGLPWVSPDEPREESLASSVCAVDFDLDGDFDVLIGNVEGTVVLVENIGTARAPLFSKGRRKLEVNGQTLRTAAGDAGPTMADWDGDGRRDLIVGAGDGSVLWYANVGGNDAPEFGAGVTLVSAAESWPLAHGSEPVRSALRAKPCVVDFDGDGALDLLVGDLWIENGKAPQLDKAALARRATLLAEHAALEAEAIELYDEGGEPDPDATASLTERFSAIYVELATFEAQPVRHGHVWLYRREAPSGLGATR